MTQFNVNDRAVIELTAKLEGLHRSAFPSAVRNTLNDLAFETKRNLPKVTSSKFVTRNKGFFKAFSVVDKANGFEVNKMAATAGINSNKGARVAENLEKQESGGSFKGRKLINHSDSRVSKSTLKRVSAKGKHGRNRVHNATPAFKTHRGTRASKYVAAVMSTKKAGANAMLLTSGAKGIVYGIKNLTTNIKTRKIKFKAEKLYVFRKDPTNRVKANNFMRDSAKLAVKDTHKIYQKNAEFQFKKHLK